MNSKMNTTTLSALVLISILSVGSASFSAEAAKAPAAAAGAPAAATAGKTMSVESGTVDFLAVGRPSFLKVKGEGAVPTGKVTVVGDKAAGEFKIDLAQFKTGMEKRDEHMKNTLEVEKYPSAIIRFKDVVLKDGAAKGTIPAELELHGQTKPVALEAEFKDGKATGKFQIKLSEFGIKPPSFAGITIKDEVDVNIDSVIK
jgi:polyisoprenoid-binding protein YceI